MPISKELNIKLGELSREDKHDEILSLFKKKLKDGIVTVTEIFNYAKGYKFIEEPGKPYVINANTINRVGAFLSCSKDAEQKKASIKFFKLAAERDDSWGNSNYAVCMLEANQTAEALTYAEKAVELAKNDQNIKHEHKLILCKALRVNLEWKKANIALVEYLKFKIENISSTKNDTLKKELEEETKEALKLCSVIIKEFRTEFENKNRNKLTNQQCCSNLEELEPFLKDKSLFNFDHESQMILQEIYYFEAKCHEKLEKYSEAMHAYCAITNKKLVYYREVVAARARLLKKQVAKDFAINPSISNTISEEKKEDLFLLNGLPFPAKFNEHWLRDTSWFHSVEEKELKDEFDKRFKQLEQLISAKETEIALIDEFLEGPSDDTVSAVEKKEILQKDLENLQVIQKKLKQKYKNHLPENRQIFRRYAAEICFFDPKRSKKRQDLIALTYKIIDQRFQYDNSESPLASVDLSGKSSRQIITAERVFQNAVVALTGKDTPNLGIPTARTKPWTIGYNTGTTGYGPVEHYQVGETEIQSEHRTSPKRNRLGDSFLPQHDSYNRDIYPFLQKLTKGEVKKEKQLATLMIRYGKNHQAVSLEELQKIYASAKQEDVDHFNGICFLIMEKEQAQWHSAIDKRFHLGMSVSQARCLIMIKAGFISFKEAFQNDTLFGIYSQTKIVDNPSKVATSCKHIDNLYLSYLQNKHAEDYFTFSKKHIDNALPPVRVLTREQAHLDMKEVYGGESDSDSENGYDTDLSM